MIFSKSLVGNSRAAKAQWEEYMQNRTLNDLTNNSLAEQARRAGLVVNNGLIPQDVYQEFDNTSVERMRLDDGDTFLNDLLPRSKSIRIGKLVHKFRQVSATSGVKTSMSGQTGVLLDRTDVTYDGSIVPIHEAGFGREWREWDALTSEGYDALIDDQRERVANVREHLADTFLDGHLDKDGNFLNVDALEWQGMRNDSRVAQIDLTAAPIFDFTDTAQTAEAIKLNWITVLDVMRITNKMGGDMNIYVSKEVMSAWERRWSTSWDAPKLQEELAGHEGVASIKSSNKLSGNELMGIPAAGDLVRPITGMALNTTPIVRHQVKDDYMFSVWAAIGWEVRTDYSGNSPAFFAQ